MNPIAGGDPPHRGRQMVHNAGNMPYTSVRRRGVRGATMRVE